MDALTHALEAVTCNCGNPVSDALAEKAILLLFRYLPEAVFDIQRPEARFEVMRASTLAGMAFGNADVAAVHCLSETLGGFMDVPHGLANAMLLAPVMRFHEPVIAPVLARLYGRLHLEMALAPADAAAQMILAIEQLTAQLAIPAFSTLDVDPKQFPAIAHEAVRNNSNSSNPQLMTAASYEQILKAL
jgi:alcohol dehydrogenase